MRANRLFEIIYILLDKKIVTAQELAERFEVSQRTIYRDVEALSSANVPIYMQKGKGGGIGLLPEFVLNKTLLSGEEKKEIIAALQSISAAGYDSGGVLSKLTAFLGTGAANWVEIDFSGWNPLTQMQFDLLKQAILTRNAISFDYFGANGGRSRREAEPLTLWFKSRAWYLKAYCVSKKDFRIFKLTRMKNILLTGRHFEAKTMPPYDDMENLPPPMLKIRLWFDKSMRYRVYDDFDDEHIAENPDGSFIVTFHAPINDWFYGYIMSFAHFAEALEPESLRSTIKDMMKKGFEKYL